MVTVVTQNSINDIIESATMHIEASKKILSTAIDTISKLANNVEGKNKLDKNLKTLNKIETFAIKYNGIVSSIINTLCDTSGVSNKNLSTLLGYTIETDANKKKVEKYTVVDAAAQIPNILNSMFGVIETLGKTKIGFKGIIMMRVRIMKLGVALRFLCKTLVKTLADVAAEFDIKEILSFLVKEPDTITNIVNSDTGDRSIKKDGSTTNNVWDKSKTETITKTGKLGLLDAFEKIFSILNVLNQLQMPSFLGLKFRLFRFKKRLGYIIKSIANFVDKNISNKTASSLQFLGNLISNDNWGLITIFKGFKKIVAESKELTYSSIAYKRSIKAINRLQSITDKLIELSKYKSFKSLQNKSVQDKFTTVGKTINKVFSIVDNIKSVVMQFVVMNRFKGILINGIDTIKLLTDKLNSFETPIKSENVENINNTIDNFTEIFEKITSAPISKSLGFKIRVIKSSLKKVCKFIEYLNGSNNANSNISNEIITDATLNTLNALNTTIGHITSIFNNIQSIKISKSINSKFSYIRTNLNEINNTITSINDVNFNSISNSIATLDLFRSFITNMRKLLFNFIMISLIPMFNITKKLNKIRNSIEVITNIIETINLTDTKNIKSSNNKLLMIHVMLKNISSLFFKLFKMSFMLMITVPVSRLAIKLIHKGIKNVLTLIQLINRSISYRKIKLASAKILMIRELLIGIKSIFTSIAALAVISILIIPAFFILIFTIFILKWTLKMIIKVLSNIALNVSLKGLLSIMLIGLFILAFSALMLLLAVTADFVLAKIPNILLFLLASAGIFLLLMGIGFLLTLAIIPLTGAAIGLALAMVIISMITLIGLMLMVLQYINFDSEAVKEKINDIFDTVKMIISTIFQKDEDTQKSDKSWLRTLVEGFGYGLITVVDSILAVAYLATMFASVLFILLLGGMLMLIERININPETINTVIDNIFNVIHNIIAKLFAPDTPAEESDKKWIRSVVEFFGMGKIAMIIDGILAVAYLATMVVAVLFITILAGQLKLIEKINIGENEKNTINKNITNVIDTCKSIIDLIFNTSDTENETSNKGWIRSVVEFFGMGKIAMIIDAIMSVAFLATMVVAVLFITILAGQLKLLESIITTEQLENAKTKVAEIIATCMTVSDYVMARKEPETEESKKGWIRSVIDFFGGGGIANIVEAIMSIAWLGMTIAIISLVKVLAEQLEYLGKVVLPTDTKDKVNSILTCADDVVSAVLDKKEPIVSEGDEEKKGFLKWLFPKATAAVEMMSRMSWLSSVISIVGSIGQMAKSLETLRDLPDVSDIKDKTSVICNTADDIAQMVVQKTGVDVEAASSRLVFLERLNIVVNSMSKIKPNDVKQVKDSISAHINLIEKINKVDITKLETSARMFEQMATFSKSIKGDFDQLAETLNEDLMPVLKELKEIMEKIPEKLDTGFQNTSASIAATNSPVTKDGVMAQIKRENPNISKEELTKETNNRMYELAQQSANNLSSKVDSVIELLKNGDVVVKTA